MQAENIGQRDTVVTVRELAKASLSDDLKLAVAEALKQVKSLAAVGVVELLFQKVGVFVQNAGAVGAYRAKAAA
jgi:hypothetical protein